MAEIGKEIMYAVEKFYPFKTQILPLAQNIDKYKLTHSVAYCSSCNPVWDRELTAVNQDSMNRYLIGPNR